MLTPQEMLTLDEFAELTALLAKLPTGMFVQIKNDPPDPDDPPGTPSRLFACLFKEPPDGGWDQWHQPSRFDPKCLAGTVLGKMWPSLLYILREVAEGKIT